MNEMKKLSFSRKKLKNFLKNSMHRNSNGSVKKPSGAQKKPGLDILTSSLTVGWWAAAAVGVKLLFTAPSSCLLIWSIFWYGFGGVFGIKPVSISLNSPRPRRLSKEDVSLTEE